MVSNNFQMVYLTGVNNVSIAIKVSRQTSMETIYDVVTYWFKQSNIKIWNQNGKELSKHETVESLGLKHKETLKYM